VIQVDRLSERLRDRDIHLSLSEAALEELASAGFDPVYGARPLKRAIQRDVMNPLALAILRGEIHDGSHVSIGYIDNAYCFHQTDS